MPKNMPSARVDRLRSESGVKDQFLAALEMEQSRTLRRIEALEAANRDLEKFRHRYELLYERAPVGFLTLDGKGIVREANEMAATLLNCPRERLLLTPLTFRITRADVEAFLRHLSRCRRSHQRQVVTQVRLHSTTGSPLVVELISLPFQEDGKRYYHTLLVDLSERRAHEHARQQAKAFAESVVETIREPLVVLDGTCRIVSVNRAFSQIFRKPASIVNGQFLEGVLNLWWSGNRLRNELDAVLLKNAALDDLEIEVEPPGLGKRVFLASARRLSPGENLPALILVAFEDITARRAAEAELRRSHDELEHRVQARTQALEESYHEMERFCYSIAHDLRSPLRAMQGFARMLVEDYGSLLPPDAHDFTKRIQEGARRMDTLILGLLEYGRLSTMELPLEPVDTDQILSGIIEDMRAEIEISGAEIHRERPLPNVLGHPIALRVAFSNFISNAIKFIAPNVKPHIRIDAEQCGDRVRILVQDNGIGIKPEHFQRIFEVFQRLHPGQQYPGTGIGLANVAKALHRIGGEIGVDSVPGQGSRFWFELPSAEPKAKSAS